MRYLLLLVLFYVCSINASAQNIDSNLSNIYVPENPSEVIIHAVNSIQSIIGRHHYISIDITCTPGNELSDSLQSYIDTQVSRRCPVELLLIEECAVYDTYQKKWGGHGIWHGEYYHSISKMVQKLAEYDCKMGGKYQRHMQDGLWGLNWLPSKDTTSKVFLYLVSQNDTPVSAENFNKLNIDKKLTTHAILFDADKSEIKTESMGYIKELAKWLNDNKDVKLEIDGHTDSDGTKEQNLKLSKARAEAVKKQLILFGVEDIRLQVKGYGASMPLSPNTTIEGKANNRRVEFIKL